MPLIFLALDRLSGFTFFKIFVTGDERMVLARLNDAWPAFFFLVILAAILRATSMGLLQVAGSATIRPLRGPDVQRNFLLILGVPPLRLSLANTPLDASSTPSYSSNIFISTYLLPSVQVSVQSFSTLCQYRLSVHIDHTDHTHHSDDGDNGNHQIEIPIFAKIWQ